MCLYRIIKFTAVKSWYKFFLFLFFITVAIPAARAQQIDNLIFSQEGIEIIITYDLIGNTENNYFITVFSSHNDFSNPLEMVTGDVGAAVSPGKGKRIVWNARQEIGDFKGNIRIRLHARAIPVIEFENLSSKFRRGKTHEISWKTGVSKDNIQFQLYGGNQLINDFGQIPNNEVWNWTVHKKQNPGKGYRLKANVGNKSAYSADFRISRKVPLMAKVLPVAAGIGGLIVVLLKDQGPKPLILPLLPE